jgi:hypothetical protein
MEKLDATYWENRWENRETGWDIGYASPAITKYFEGVTTKDSQILIPGAGNAYEAEALYKMGFTNVHVVDIAKGAIESFTSRCMKFPAKNIHHQDFFSLEGKFDYIVEQTFFCALNPEMREAYCKKMSELLAPTGTLLGVWFNIPLNTDHPPFGGHSAEYKTLFDEYFNIEKMEECYNSIKPREGNELFVELTPKG